MNPLFVDLGHEQADLVAVAREHDPHRARWIEAGDHIPMQVRSRTSVREFARVLPHHVLHRPLVTGRTGSFQQRL
jgi:predicted RNA-binding protein (virulence factor B family)